MRRTTVLSLALLAGCQAWAAVNVPLIIQEAIYPGSIAGVDRTAEPVTVGIPLPDDPTIGISDANQLTLTGVAAGQFRVLGRWPSGRIKWVQVDTQVNLAAGQKNTSVALRSGGSGNFGGANLATDNGVAITVDTGPAQFVVKKAHFNVLDRVIVNGRELIAPGTSQGLVVTGPPPGETACGTCATVYSSTNDPQSTAIIEENGPVRTVIKATGYHKDQSGNTYMAFTVRLIFYKGKSFVKATSILRNADYGPSNSFNSAYKGFEAYELRLNTALAGDKTFSFGTHTGPVSGKLDGADSAYLFQGSSDSLRHGHYCGFGCVPLSTDTGYEVLKNEQVLLSGNNKQYPEGWANVSDGTGAGIGIGVYQLAGVFPKSLELAKGGSEVRVGIWPRQNSTPHYQSWPQWSVHDLFLDFHSSASSSRDEFFRFQHYLVARASREHYNDSKVFLYPLIDPSEEDTYFSATGTSAVPSISPSRVCCVQDFGTSNAMFPISVFRWFGWRSAGGGGFGNQAEFRWSFLMNFLTRGWAGRYLVAAHFYRFQAEQSHPHSDDFNWRDRPLSELNWWGFPERIISANSSKAHRAWIDQEHAHWYGMMDFYFMSGDETILEGILGGPKDRYLNPNVGLNNPRGDASSGLYNTRSIGAQLMSTARLYQFLKAIGDSDADATLAQGIKTYNWQVKPDLCVSGFPTGCNAGAKDVLAGGRDSGTQGVSRTRGLHWGPSGRSGSWCSEPHQYRVNSVLQNSILMQGIWELREIAGPGWADYENSLDLAYGMSQWALSETYVDDGTERWDSNGYRFGIALDAASGPPCAEPNWAPYTGATVWFPFFIQHAVNGTTDWKNRFDTVLRKNMGNVGIFSTDFGTFQITSVIDKVLRPGTTRLVHVPMTVSSGGNGQYVLSWAVPAGAQSYRIKWGPRRIVDWVGFDAGTNTWIGDPAGSMPWFAANNVPDAPAPGEAGSQQSVTVNTGVSGLTSANFSVKAYVHQGQQTTTPATLLMASGDKQSGTAGQALASPFVVKVVDAAGLPVSGTPVAFTVTAGDGSLSPTEVVSGSLGLASTRLTLGSSAGTHIVVASSKAVAGSITFTATAAVAATTLVVVSGNDQTGSTGQPLTNPFTVRVDDAVGKPMSGVEVTFVVTSGGGMLSATKVATSPQGLASATLTLGPSPGVNIVSASVSAGNSAVFNATADTPPSGPANVSWALQPRTAGWPGYNGYHTLLFDPVSRQTVLYGVVDGSSSIYSTDVFFYNAGSNTWTHVGGTGNKANTCAPSTPTQPGDRHPVGQMTIDTKRNVLWLAGGVCQGINRQDMYYLTLNPDPRDNKWYQVTPQVFPVANNSSAMVYDPDNDVLFWYGSDSGSQKRTHWVYCPTLGNDNPGILAPGQAAAGCTAPDDWTEIRPAGDVQPRAVAFPGMLYDRITKRVILFGGNSGGLVAQNETWAYDVPTRTWTQKALSTTPPPVYSGTFVAQPAWAYNSMTNKILYHQVSNTGAPADWQYDPAADIWEKLVSTGSGAAIDQVMTFDHHNNVLVGFNRNKATLKAEVWLGKLAGQPASSMLCDVNRDEKVDVVDVQMTISQAINAFMCDIGDVNGDGVCNVVDVQQVVIAAQGGACVSGP